MVCQRVVVGQALLLLYWEGVEEMVYQGMVVGQALLLQYREVVEAMVYPWLMVQMDFPKEEVEEEP